MSSIRSLNTPIRGWQSSLSFNLSASSSSTATQFARTRFTHRELLPPRKMASSHSSDSLSAMATSNPVTGDVHVKDGRTEEEPLPKLTPAELRDFNRMADRMNYFHDNFRATWNMLYSACETKKRPRGMSIRQFISAGQQFCYHLTLHHTYEEQHIFPVLAKKMPAFRKELELLTQHKQIHKGLDRLEKYLEECHNGEIELQMNELKDILDTFGKVLWQHLDDEVKQLGAENMRKYWTVEEVRRILM